MFFYFYKVGSRETLKLGNLGTTGILWHRGPVGIQSPHGLLFLLPSKPILDFHPGFSFGDLWTVGFLFPFTRPYSQVETLILRFISDLAHFDRKS